MSASAGGDFRRGDPRNSAVAERAQTVEHEREWRDLRGNGASRPEKQVDAVRRDLADERKGEMEVRRGRRAAARLAGDRLREIGERRARGGIGPEGEEHPRGRSAAVAAGRRHAGVRLHRSSLGFRRDSPQNAAPDG